MNWVIVPEDILSQEVGEELVLLNIATERYFGLNATARRFLEVAKASKDRASALSAISAEFSISIEHAEADLDSLLVALRERNLIVDSLAQ